MDMRSMDGGPRGGFLDTDVQGGAMFDCICPEIRYFVKLRYLGLVVRLANAFFGATPYP